jgi:RNA polymerase sigma-70 factor (ECF subfamily)
MVNEFDEDIKKTKTKNQPTDEELIKRFQDGDNYAFDQIVKRYKDQLLNFVYRFINDLTEAEDIVQETFCRVFTHKNYYRNVAKFSTWIYTIASNLSKTELRRRKRRRYFLLNDNKSKEAQIENHDTNPEQDANTRVTEKMIQDAISKLSPKFRQVIILRDIQGFSYEEISEMIHVPLGTVKSRVNRGRLKLQEDLSYLL